MTPDTIKRHIADWRERERQSLTNYGRAEAKGAIAALQALLDEAETLAPGDDEIVRAMDLAYRKAGVLSPTLNQLRAALAAARSMILRQAAQAAPASTMRSEAEVRAEIEQWNTRLNEVGLSELETTTYSVIINALRWALNEQEAGR